MIFKMEKSFYAIMKEMSGNSTKLRGIHTPIQRKPACDNLQGRRTGSTNTQKSLRSLFGRRCTPSGGRCPNNGFSLKSTELMDIGKTH